MVAIAAGKLCMRVTGRFDSDIHVHHRNIGETCGSWGSHSGGYEKFYFWNVTPCSPSNVSGRFGGICRVHLQDWTVKQARNQHEKGRAMVAIFFIRISCWLTLKLWKWMLHVSQKRRLAFSGLHGVISHKTQLFIDETWHLIWRPCGMIFFLPFWN
jgi:hypothetical protein